MPPEAEPPVAGWLTPDGLDGALGAAFTLRGGGASVGPYASLNLGDHVGDQPDAVAANRAAFADALGVRPVYLRQVHGTEVLRLTRRDAEDAAQGRPAPEADACVTTDSGVACTILVADCLPVLFAAPGGRGVAAAHAGWRGLAAGVLEATVQELCNAVRCAPDELSAWLGPCIGPERFEVGDDVLLACGTTPEAADPQTFRRALRSDGSACWRADLPRLARERLQRSGLHRISGGQWCTASDASRFFSFRRDGTTGRMAAAIWC